MNIKVFSIRDAKAAVYGAPFVVANTLVAKRMVADMLAEGRTIQSRHPEDFDLFAIATFDDASGKISPIELEHICGLQSLMPNADS